MFCFNNLVPSPMFSADREHSRRKKAKKSNTNLNQSKCVALILHSKQESLEKLRQAGSKANSTKEDGNLDRKVFLHQRCKNFMEPTFRGSWKKKSQWKLQDEAGDSRIFKEPRSNRGEKAEQQKSCVMGIQKYQDKVRIFHQTVIRKVKQDHRYDPSTSAMDWSFLLLEIKAMKMHRWRKNQSLK